MNKYMFIFLMILALCVSPIVAQSNGGDNGNNGNNNPPQYNTVAQQFMTEVTDFTTQYLTNVQGLNSQAYLTELDAIASQIPADADLSHFNPQAYLDGIAPQVSSMVSTINGYTQRGAYTTDNYLKEVANFLVKEYLKDMRNGVTDIDTATYINDISIINERYSSELDLLAHPPTGGESGGAAFNPTDHLDQVAGAKQKRAIEIEVLWLGVGNHWSGRNMQSLLYAFQSRYGSNAVAQADLSDLQYMWPQSAEVYLQNAAYNGNWYSGANARDEQTGSYRNEYFANEYGNMMTRDQATGNSFYNSQMNLTQGQSGNIQNEGSYNNRSWNYRYNNGTYTTIRITTNGHQYSLQETVFTSPLILDLDGDGKLEASNGKWLPHLYENTKLVEFDMNGDGFVDLCEWVGPNDGLLLVQSDEVTGNNFFGNAGGFLSGYEKLSLLDKNGDQKISGEELKPLSVWQDKNGNAKTDAGEVTSVEKLGITEIQVTHQEYVSSFVQNGASKKVWDWYPCLFEVKRTK
jgi:hypothetical protein